MAVATASDMRGGAHRSLREVLASFHGVSPYLACQMADALGYSMVEPLKGAALDELLGLLPAAARAHFPSEPEILEQIIANGMGEDDPLWNPPSSDRQIEPLPP